MDERKREFLERHYSADQWRGRKATPGVVRNLSLASFKLAGWTMLRAQRNEGPPPFLHSMWRRGDGDEIISIRTIECADAAAAHEQLLAELGNFQSPAVERRTGPEALGDVAFGLGETTAISARANVVVVILNAGRRPVSVTAVARELDALIVDQLNTR